MLSPFARGMIKFAEAPSQNVIGCDSVKDNQTEEKALPASQKKLRDSRKKGQVSSSRDFVSGFSLLAVLIYLLMVWPAIRDRVLELVALVSRIYLEPFDAASQSAIALSINVIWHSLLPAIAVVILVSVVAGMVGTLGPVFSFNSIKPNFEHINPAAGLKRIFSMRNVVEFAKSSAKVVLLGSALFLVLRTWLQAMFHVPNCGQSCVVPLLLAAAKPILVVAALAFVLIGFSDLVIQRWLFLRDMKMTRTEQKRERKDIEGDPLILGARKRERVRQSRAPRLGLAAASFLISGDDHIAGVRYNRKDMPVPVVVIKSRGKAAIAIREAAGQLNIPITEDPLLAVDLAAKHRPGDYVHPRHFAAIARILIQQGLV